MISCEFKLHAYKTRSIVVSFLIISLVPRKIYWTKSKYGRHWGEVVWIEACAPLASVSSLFSTERHNEIEMTQIEFPFNRPKRTQHTCQYNYWTTEDNQLLNVAVFDEDETNGALVGLPLSLSTAWARQICLRTWFIYMEACGWTQFTYLLSFRWCNMTSDMFSSAKCLISSPSPKQF